MKSISRTLIFVFIFICLTQVVFGIGIKPSKYSVDFVPSLEAEFGFTVSDTDDNTNIRIDVHGDLLEYVTLSNDLITHSGPHSFIAFVKLPAVVEKPGNNRILIRATLEPIGSLGGGIGAIGAVQAPIDVIVPYPGKYLEYHFITRDVNEGESVPITLTVINLGTQTVDQVSGDITIFDSANNKLSTINLEAVPVFSKGSYTYEKTLDSTNYRPGSYKAVATVNHDDGQKILERTIRVGTLQVDIVNYTKDFLTDTINKFELKVDSKWNTPIEQIYGEVNVTKDGAHISTFRTFSVPLGAWETKILDGFFDTTGIGVGEYDGDVVLHYAGVTTEEKIKINVLSKSKFELTSGLTITVLLILIILAIIGVDVWWMIHRHKKKEIEENEKK